MFLLSEKHKKEQQKFLEHGNGCSVCEKWRKIIISPSIYTQKKNAVN